MNFIELIFLAYYTFVIILMETNYKHTKYYSWCVSFILFLSIKWIFNYRKCTFSYIEVKLRGVKKEEGIIYRILDNCMELRENKTIVLFYLITFILCLEYYYRFNTVFGII